MRPGRRLRPRASRPPARAHVAARLVPPRRTRRRSRSRAGRAMQHRTWRVLRRSARATCRHRRPADRRRRPRPPTSRTTRSRVPTRGAPGARLPRPGRPPTGRSAPRPRSRRARSRRTRGVRARPARASPPRDARVRCATRTVRAPCSTRSAARSVHAAPPGPRGPGADIGPGSRRLIAARGRLRRLRRLRRRVASDGAQVHHGLVRCRRHQRASGSVGISGRTQRPRRAPRRARPATAHRSTRRRPAAASRRRRLRAPRSWAHAATEGARTADRAHRPPLADHPGRPLPRSLRRSPAWAEATSGPGPRRGPPGPPSQRVAHGDAPGRPDGDAGRYRTERGRSVTACGISWANLPSGTGFPCGSVAIQGYLGARARCVTGRPATTSPTRGRYEHPVPAGSFHRHESGRCHAGSLTSSFPGDANTERQLHESSRTQASVDSTAHDRSGPRDRGRVTRTGGRSPGRPSRPRR